MGDPQQPESRVQVRTGARVQVDRRPWPMNLNKADRKVFLPPREPLRKRTPKKKGSDFNDEVYLGCGACRAALC